MTNPFQPADGKRARWRYLYDLVVERQPGDEITVDEVMELLDIDHITSRAVMLEAKKHLERDRQRTVKTVEKFGWIVIDARGNLEEIQKRREKAYRAADLGVRLVVATQDRRGELSQIERSRLDFEARNFVAASNLGSRKTKAFGELEKESKQQEKPGLPFRKTESA